MIPSIFLRYCWLLYLLWYALLTVCVAILAGGLAGAGKPDQALAAGAVAVACGVLTRSAYRSLCAL